MYSQINCGRYSYKLISTSPVNYFLLIANNLSGIMLNSIIVQCLCKRCTSVTSWKAFYFLLCSTFFMAFENTWTKLKYKASGESHPSTALVGSGKEHSEPEPLQLTTITSTHVAVDLNLFKLSTMWNRKKGKTSTVIIWEQHFLPGCGCFAEKHNAKNSSNGRSCVALWLLLEMALGEWSNGILLITWQLNKVPMVHY